MKHFDVYIESTNFWGVWDEFQAWAESEDDPKLLDEISSQTIEMEAEYLDEDEIEEGVEWTTHIIPWEDMHYSKEVEEDMPILYDGRNNS